MFGVQIGEQIGHGAAADGREKCGPDIISRSRRLPSVIEQTCCDGSSVCRVRSVIAGKYRCADISD
ncbi:hypothetical protein BFF94_033635 [Burkholderia catarinensis]|nr:hypothetical protein BFF94_033635 [Burkholderia catarinensis]